MDLETAIKGLTSAQKALRSREGVNNPVFMSEQMMRLSQYAGAVEEHLANYERDLETDYAQRLHAYMIDQKMKVTQAERMVDMDTAFAKGQVKYLTRIVASAWKQVGVIQSRINHLTREATTQM